MNKMLPVSLACLLSAPAWADALPSNDAGFVRGHAVYSVCASGCQFTDPAAAFRAASDAAQYGTPSIVIKISDGIYRETGQLYTENPLDHNISIVGDPQDPAKVVLDFTNIAGTNQNGIMAANGGNIGHIDGLTINGVGAQTARTDRGTSWRHDSYGAGIIARSGGYIGLGPHVVVNHFYYSVEADQGGVVNAPDGGVTGTDAGDVNFMARHNGTIICPHCQAIRAADTTAPPTLGCNFTAEEGGSLWIDGSSGRESFTAGLCILSASHAWAHKLSLLGGLGGRQGNGIWATENGYGETEGSVVSGYAIGVYVNNGGGLDLTGDTVSGSLNDGIQADGGRINGVHIASRGNGGFGYHALHQGIIQAYESLGATNGNRLGRAAVEPAGALSGFSYQGSSLLLN